MTEPERITADVLIAAGVMPEQERAIVDVLSSHGVAARVRVVPARRGGDLQWLVLAILPLQAFLTTLGSTFADEVTQVLRRLVGRPHQTSRSSSPPQQVLVLQDSATRVQVVLEADLPSDAYVALLSLDLSKFRHGPVHYDRNQRKWRSELDEWEDRTSSPRHERQGPGGDPETAGPGRT